jgi:CubicO group peptidase (beta-lactamase class C family)
MLTRRAFALASAAAFAVPARAQSSPFAQAAAFSAKSAGVSMVVMQAGKILFEDYPNEGGQKRAWELASGTKSFCGILAAAAAKDGLLTLDETCAQTLPEWKADNRAKITIRQLLTLTSGLGGGTLGRPPTYAQAVAMQAFVSPGARFAYGPAPFQAFGEILRRKLIAAGEQGDPQAYLQKRVLDGIGIAPGRWRRGEDGNPHLPSGAAFTARDWAVFGQYVLDGGAGLDVGVMATLFEPTKANPGYGLTWWLLRPGLIGPSPRSGVDAGEIPNAEAEKIVMAAGAGNQRLYLCRTRKLVIVRQASGVLRAMRGQGAAWSDKEFLRLSLGA